VQTTHVESTGYFVGSLSLLFHRNVREAQATSLCIKATRVLKIFKKRRKRSSALESSTTFPKFSHCGWESDELLALEAIPTGKTETQINIAPKSGIARETTAARERGRHYLRHVLASPPGAQAKCECMSKAEGSVHTDYLFRQNRTALWSDAFLGGKRWFDSSFARGFREQASVSVQQAPVCSSIVSNYPHDRMFGTRPSAFRHKQSSSMALVSRSHRIRPKWCAA